MRGLAVIVVALVALAVAAPAVHTNTAYVEAISTGAREIWVATRGGLEAYDRTGSVRTAFARTRLVTTADGLPGNAVAAVAIEGDTGAVRAWVAGTACVVSAAGVRCGAGASCETAVRETCRTGAPPPRAEAPTARSFRGARVTAEAAVPEGRLVGTAGAGLWLVPLSGAPRRLTPGDQICSNHVVAAARFAGRLWLGSFDEGLCSFDGRRWTAAALGAPMINDLAATDEGLFVATTAGLFRTRDGETFTRAAALDGQGAVDLAYDRTARTLYAVTSVALWRIPISPSPRGRNGPRGRSGPRGWLRPGGSRALQAVDVDAQTGVVWLASEDRGVLRMRGAEVTVLDRAAGLPSSWVLDVAATAGGGAVAATLRDGLVRIAADGRAGVVPGTAGTWGLHVSQGPRSLWYGSQGGLTAVSTTGSAPRPVPNPNVHVVFFDAESGATWAGTEGGTVMWPAAAHQAGTPK